MAQKFDIGIGAKVEIQKDGESTWFDLDGVRSFDQVDGEMEEIDVTYMKSPNRQREFISGFADNGEVSVVLLRSVGSATDLLLKEIKASGELVKVRFTVPASAEDATDDVGIFFAFLKSYARPVAYNEVTEATATFRVGPQTTAT